MSAKQLELDALKKLDAELREAWSARTLPAGAISTDSIAGLSRVIAAIEVDIAKQVEPVEVQVCTRGGSWRKVDGGAPRAEQLARDYPNVYQIRRLYTTPQEPALPQALIKALEDAAMSLETISILAGRATYGNPPIESYMGEHTEVRMYAKSRAEAARQSLASPGGAA